MPTGHSGGQRPGTGPSHPAVMGEEAGYRDPPYPARQVAAERLVGRYTTTVRHQWLSLYLFADIKEVQDTATQWLRTYNHERPNMTLGGITPAQRLARKMKTEAAA